VEKKAAPVAKDELTRVAADECGETLGCEGEGREVVIWVLNGLPSWYRCALSLTLPDLHLDASVSISRAQPSRGFQ